MTGALVILAAMVVVGTLLFITDKTYFRHHHGEIPTDTDATKKKEDPTATDEICCGQHLVCEKISLALTSDEIIYYDDEELDRFIGRSPESYTYEETEEFRDVLMTLLPEDVSGWAKSISLRKIELPVEVKDELFMLVSDVRTSPGS